VLAEARILGMLLGVTLGTTLFAASGGQTGKPWGPADFAALHAAVRWAIWVALGGAIVASLRGEKPQLAPGGRSRLEDA